MLEDADVRDVGNVQRVLASMGDEYSVRILSAADEPRSAQQLSAELDVPIATCYRRIEALEDVGLLTCVGRETSNKGRRTKVYRRTVDTVALELDGDRPVLAVDSRDDDADPLLDQRE